MGKINHYFYMPAGSPTNLSRARADVPHGKISSVALPTHQMIAGKTREVYFYQPPVEQPVPLVVVWDGKEYLRRARLPMIVDNLIAQKRIAPIALALVPNGGVYRFMEYTASEATLVWILSSVLPEAAQKCNLLDLKSHPGAYGVMGASLGGLMSLFAGLRVPDVFGKVLSQSGAFTLREFHTVVWDEVQSSVPIQNHIWMDVGSYEGLLPANREMHQLLIEKDCKHGYHEYSGGHNYPSWRNDVANGLEALFPPID
jgi:enterochelin esterase family protein